MKEQQTVKKRRILPILIVALILMITVGYAALSTTMSITGTTTIKGNSWNIEFVNYANASMSDGVSISSAPHTVSGSTNQTQYLEYSVVLPHPGDYYEFTIDLKNTGSIAARLSENPVVDSSSTNVQHTVTDVNGNAITPGTVLQPGGSMRVKIRVAYRRDISNEQLNTSDRLETFKVKFSFVQN